MDETPRQNTPGANPEPAQPAVPVNTNSISIPPTPPIRPTGVSTPDNAPLSSQQPSFEEATNGVDLSDSPRSNNLDGHVIEWTASEYIAHHKSVRWYGTLALAALVVAGLVWLFTKDTISAMVVVVGAAVLGVYGARQPRELLYRIDSSGLTIEGKYYDLGSFRCFSVDDDQTFASIIFLPLKRFGAPITIYFAPEDEVAIVDTIAISLPIETHQPDPIDRLMRKIRF